MLHLQNRLGTFHSGPRTARPTPRLFEPIKQKSGIECVHSFAEDECHKLDNGQGASGCKPNGATGDTVNHSTSGIESNTYPTPIPVQEPLYDSVPVDQAGLSQYKPGDFIPGDTVVELLRFDKWENGELAKFPERIGTIDKIKTSVTKEFNGEPCIVLAKSAYIWPVRAVRIVKNEIEVGDTVERFDGTWLNGTECLNGGIIVIEKIEDHPRNGESCAIKSAQYHPIRLCRLISKCNSVVESEPQAKDGWEKVTHCDSSIVAVSWIKRGQCGREFVYLMKDGSWEEIGPVKYATWVDLKAKKMTPAVVTEKHTNGIF